MCQTCQHSFLLKISLLINIKVEDDKNNNRYKFFFLWLLNNVSFRPMNILQEELMNILITDILTHRVRVAINFVPLTVWAKFSDYTYYKLSHLYLVLLKTMYCSMFLRKHYIFHFQDNLWKPSFCFLTCQPIFVWGPPIFMGVFNFPMVTSVKFAYD